MQRRETDAPPPDDSVVDERIASTETLPRGARNVCWMRLIKTSAVLLFLCGLVGAFIYAVNSREFKCIIMWDLKKVMWGKV